MKEALYWELQNKDTVKCRLCPHECIIPEGKAGVCGARKNISGKLFTLNYSKPVSIAIDPIEKKPLFHFLPGSSVLSFGTYGCNFSCKNCQNFDITMIKGRQPENEVPPENIVEIALANKCQGIAYTYNEPTIFFEYMLDCAKLARKEGLKNIMVSNGYINPEPLKELSRYMDAANIDLKAFDEDFYRTNCKARLEPVKAALKQLAESKVWLEITTLMIPTLNDDMKEFEQQVKWISAELGRDIPFHISRFFPLHELSHLEPTPESTLSKARQIADRSLDYVYVGNIHKPGSEDTICPDCGKLVIKRQGYAIKEKHLKEGNCAFCGRKINGVF